MWLAEKGAALAPLRSNPGKIAGQLKQFMPQCGARIAGSASSFDHHLQGIKGMHRSTGQQFVELLTGEAGTGKSYAFKVCEQAVIREFARRLEGQQNGNVGQSGLQGEGPVTITACATGKAACHVDGTTIHSAFGFGKNQPFADLPLMSESTANAARVGYQACPRAVL